LKALSKEKKIKNEELFPHIVPNTVSWPSYFQALDVKAIVDVAVSDIVGGQNCQMKNEEDQRRMEADKRELSF
jgi:hypothetical protein